MVPVYTTTTMVLWKRAFASIIVGFMVLAVFSVLIPHIRTTESSCVASLVRQVPCDQNVPFSSLDFHLQAYKTLSNGLVGSVTVALSLMVLFGGLAGSMLCLIVVGLMRPAVSPERGSIFREIHPWRWFFRWYHWYALRERSTAVLA